MSDRRVVISYDAGRRRFACRQVTRLDPETGHQSQILTTRGDEDPALNAHLMFSRSSQENFFRYMRAHFALDPLDALDALDALDTYVTVGDDPDRPVPNPARRKADRALAEAQRSLARAEVTEGRASLEQRGGDPAIVDAFVEANAEIERLAEAARAIPARVRLGQVRPGSVRMAPDRKRIHDAIRMATYNAESALARLLGPHYARAQDEARTLLREAFTTSADVVVVGEELHVRLDPLSAPRRSRAIAGLCEELTVARATFPGTFLTVVYSVKDAR
ncbi:MAG: putative transposase [Acidimicrobiales bacterium]